MTRLSETILLPVIAVLLLLCGIATRVAVHYHTLYDNKPQQVKIERHTSVINHYPEFNPNRSSAYTCIPQKVKNSVGMVCNSPDDDVTINCTEAASGPLEYFC